MSIKKPIYFVTALHGNEQIPTIALASQNIEQIVANPPALIANKRFLEMDMNKAFNTGSLKTSEEKEAKIVLEVLNQKEEGFVVDFHTTSCKTEPFAIIVDPKMAGFASAVGVKHVVYMKHNIKAGHALINHYPGISIEAGTHNTKEAFDTTIQIVQAALKGTQEEVVLYEVYDTITKEGEYENFKDHEQGFIPVLAGEQSYDFFGLKARKVNSLK